MRHFSLRLVFISLSVAFAITTGAPAATVNLVVDGKPQSVILLTGFPHPDEQLAAIEIVEHVRRISGAEMRIMPDGSADVGNLLQVRLGAGLFPDAKEAILAEGNDAAAFVLSVAPEAIHLAGLSPEGTLFAAYELLEQFGIRWCMPGELGTVIPKNRTVGVLAQETVQVPSFKTRLLQAVPFPAWNRRMRHGGPNAGAHGLPFEADRHDRPELFCEENGQPTHQIRVSHPEVLRRTVGATLAAFREDSALRYISMGPNDGAGFGADPWDAADIDPLHGKVSVTDRYVKFFNLVLEQVQQEFPGAGIAFYAYSQYMRPPVREKPNPSILPVFAPIDLCRFHTVGNPLCPERAYLKKVVSGWKALGTKVFYRGYFFNLADQGLPFTMMRQIAEEIPYYHELGAIGCRVECMPMWGHHAPSLYLASKLFWNVNADPQAIIDDYFAKFYGQAGKAMQAYFEKLEAAFGQADFHTGNVFDMPHILTDEVMNSLDGHLSRASRRAQRGETLARVSMVRLVHSYGEANLAMMAALNDFDFLEAKKQLDRASDLREQAISADPPLLWPRASGLYMDRFWSTTVDGAYERVQNGNEIAVQLPDEWLFLLDPLNGGEDLGFWKPGMGTNNWQPLKTYSTSWGNQGLRYYKGEGWYRTTIEVPHRYEGRQLRLWLGGVDDTPTAWINGTKLPELQKGAAPSGRPWEFDASNGLRVGGPNVIVVRVSNRRIDELGTGGLTAPAMLWAPAESPP